VKCRIEDCDRDAVVTRLCRPHYLRQWRSRNPDYMPAWREANRDKLAGYRQAYERRHPGRKH